MKKDIKIYVAGHKGLIGSTYIRFFLNNNYTNFVIRNRKNPELTSEASTNNFFRIIMHVST